MQIKYRGCHVKRDIKTDDVFLKVGLSFYPDVIDKTYALHYVNVPVFPPEGYPGEVDEFGTPIDQKDYDAWEAGLPHIWRLNPCLSHFVIVPETILLEDVQLFLEQRLTPDVAKTIDDIMVLPNSIHSISPFMRDKSALLKRKVLTKDYADLIASVNSRLGSLAVAKEGGDSLSFESDSIDIGPGAADYNTSFSTGYTFVDIDNPANGTGNLDTLQVRFATGPVTNVQEGTFYGTPPTFTNRDGESLGEVAAGSTQTFSGLTCDVTLEDFIGVYGDGGKTIESNTTGGTNFYYTFGDQFGTGSQTYTLYSSGRKVALYGTGTEAGGAAFRQRVIIC